MSRFMFWYGIVLVAAYVCVSILAGLGSAYPEYRHVSAIASKWGFPSMYLFLMVRIWAGALLQRRGGVPRTMDSPLQIAIGLTISSVFSFGALLMGTILGVLPVIAGVAGLLTVAVMLYVMRKRGEFNS